MARSNLWFRCNCIVLKGKNGRYKVYKNIKAGHAAGAKECLGKVTLEQNIEFDHDWDGVPTTRFLGWKLVCNKCRHIYDTIDIDTAKGYIADHIF